MLVFAMRSKVTNLRSEIPNNDLKEKQKENSSLSPLVIFQESQSVLCTFQEDVLQRIFHNQPQRECHLKMEKDGNELLKMEP